MAIPKDWVARLRASVRSATALSAMGVFSAAVIAVCLNIVVHRFYKRWDLTSSGLYTLSLATAETLHSLEDPIDVIVFLSASDPLTVSVHHMLTAYGAETAKLRPRFVDPDRDPAEFLALQKQYGIAAGKTEDGRIVTDASIVIARGEKHWFITNDDIVVYDEEDNRARPKLEQALTEGIRNVIGKEKVEVCFTHGHQEASSDDGGPQGLAELKFRIQKDNYTTRVVDLLSPAKDQTLKDCRVVIVAGPEVPFTPSAEKRLEEHLRRGGALLLLLNPVLDDSNRIRSSGLEALTAIAGIELGNDFVIERDPALRMPQGLGETYLAKPQEHSITAGLLQGDTPKYVPVLTASQSLRAGKNGAAKALLMTSPRAFSVKDIRPFVEEGREVEKRAGDASGPFAVAMAAELPKRGPEDQHGPRVVVIGSTNVAFGQSFRDSTLLGNSLLVQSAVSWLAAQPSIVNVPEKPSHAAGLNLTEDSLGQVFWYVLVYMPVTALLLGLFVLYRRRALERKSRRTVNS